MLEDVSILITTFLRDGYLKECIRRIRSMHPKICIIVVDDGQRTSEKDAIMNSWHNDADCNDQWINLPFDSGLPAKRNIGAKHCITKYMLMGCDDFDFGKQEAWEGILTLEKILDENPEIDVASGRRSNEPYEGFMKIVPGKYIKETWLKPDGTKEFYKVDLTVNYFLARTEMVRMYPWDERMKIGGEHGDWFLDLQAGNRTVVWVPGVNITEFSVPNGAHPEYGRYRGRAVKLGHAVLLEKRGVVDYKGFGDPE